jgi:pSer/pThr/pTyr-binding forkhead associated (FHA) protein
VDVVHESTPSELKERIAAERAGRPFLLLRDADGNQRIAPLEGDGGPLAIGRGERCPIRLEWDGEISRVHAELLCVAGDWTVVDDGLSRNGSYVNGERVIGRRRLRDGDTLSMGATTMVFRLPDRATPGESTRTSAEARRVATVSEAQRRVLVALCRPFGDERGLASPARNQEIADELCLTVAAVKTHLRALFARFGVEQLPQNEKRLRLVELALQSGIVTPKDLTPRADRYSASA